MWNDPLKLNSTPRNIEVKVFLDEDYWMFGSTCHKHKKYLPCYAIVQRLSGDSFYDFDLLTKKGVVHSCGYANGMKLK
jgi:hypothetical protein